MVWWVLEAGDVVVVEQVGASAVATRAVALLHEAFLAVRGVTAPVRHVDRVGSGVVDHRSQQRFRRDPLDDGLGERRAVIEGAPVASYVHDDLGDDAAGALGEDLFEPVGVLLVGGGPVVAGAGSGAHDDAGQCRDEDPGQQRGQADGEGDHAVGFGAPPHTAQCMLVGFEGRGVGVVPEPDRQRPAELRGGDVDRDGQQLRLVVRGGDPGQRPHLRIRHSTGCERVRQRGQLGESATDTDPFPGGAGLHIGDPSQPVRRGRRVRDPLGGVRERRGQNHQPVLAFRPVPGHRHQLVGQRTRARTHDDS